MSTVVADTTGLGAIRSLDYVIVLCDDFEAMKQFYCSLFGFQVEEERPGKMICLRLGTLFLGLRARGRPYDGPKVPDASASIQLSFQVPPDDVDLAHETLVKRGVELIEPPTNQDWTHRTLFFKDPENNVLEIFAEIPERETLDEPSGLHLWDQS